MDIPEIPQLDHSLKKSQTHSFALPSISRKKNSINVRYNKTSRLKNSNTQIQHRSVFMQKIKDLTQDAKYEQMQMSSINKQHTKLKNLLREFNHETYHILGKYIDKGPTKPPTETFSREMGRTNSKKRATSMSLAQVREVRVKQIQNNQQILEICKRELDKLQKLSQNLKYVTVQDYERKIVDVRKQIEQTRNSNKQIIKGNTLRGLGLKKCQIQQSHQVSQLQYEKYILELKKQRLSNDTKHVDEQQNSLTQKINKIDKDINSIQQSYNQIINQQKSQQEQEAIKSKLQNKRKVLSMAKGKSTSKPGTVTQSKYQTQYLKLLKQLDAITKKSKKLDDDTQVLKNKVTQSKKQMLINQHKLALMKKGMMNDKNLDQIIEQKKKEQCNVN